MKELILKKDFYQIIFNHYKKDSQFRLLNNNNERISFFAINEILKISNERRIIKISIFQIEFNSILDVIIINLAFILILRDNIRRFMKFITIFIKSSRIRKTNNRVKFDKIFNFKN